MKKYYSVFFLWVFFSFVTSPIQAQTTTYEIRSYPGHAPYYSNHPTQYYPPPTYHVVPVPAAYAPRRNYPSFWINTPVVAPVIRPYYLPSSSGGTYYFPKTYGPTPLNVYTP